MADEDSKIQGNMHSSIRTQIADGTGPLTRIFGLNPAKASMIHVEPNTENFTLSLTSTVKKIDGGNLADMTDPDVMWNVASASGVTAYFAGDNQLISGVKILSNPSGNDVDISITQVDN